MLPRIHRIFKRKIKGPVVKGAIFLVLASVVFGGLIFVSGRAIIFEAKRDNKALTPFPIGVDPVRRQISENPSVDAYFKKYISSKSSASRSHTSWLGRVIGKLALQGWYQILASPGSRILVIQSGERKEETAENFGKILGWERTERQEFLSLVTAELPQLSEGKFAPNTYIVTPEAIPSDVANSVIDKFQKEVLARYPEKLEQKVSLKDALIIASLLEREAADFEEMRIISGIIWNRLFSGMKLQIDATLQYVRGSKVGEPWWPRVRPSDKHLSSPYNTYKNLGLPPAPIANPSMDAILAALNPKKTDCVFYFHDAGGEFHCSPTYKEHVALLEKYYGQGK